LNTSAFVVLMLCISASVQAQPDLSGVWNFSALTPLERPLELGDKAVLTPAEAKALLEKSDRQTRLMNPPALPNSMWKSTTTFGSMRVRIWMLN